MIVAGGARRGWVLDAIQALPALIQGKHVMRSVPRLPEASGPVDGNVPAPREGAPIARPLELVVIGESTAAGVGARTHEDALVGRLARHLAATRGRSVHWRVAGRNGATIRRIRHRLLPEIANNPADVVVIVAGVNDVVAGRSGAEWSEHLRAMLDVLAGPGRAVIVAGIAPFRDFPALPSPLRPFLERKARRLDGLTREICEEYCAVFVPFDAGERIGPDFFASDNFHPSEAGYAQWAALIVAHLPDAV